MRHPTTLVATIAVSLVGCGGDATAVDSGVDAAMGPCTDAAACDDGVFCNGVERCEMGTCAPAVDPPCGALACEESSSTCITECAADPDADGDGYDAIACGGDDCDDTLPFVHPAAVERPGDGIDEDCDSFELCYLNADGDSFRTDVTNISPDLDCAGVGEAPEELPAGDCNDIDATIFPGANEVIADGVDQDCDGFESCFADIDADGFRPDATSTVPSADLDCFDPGEADGAIPVGDCDDTDPLRNPAAAEVIGDEVDQDCDGSELCYADADGDGYRRTVVTTVVSADLACDGAGEVGHLAQAGDCSDSDDTRYPGAAETCNGLDDSCDGRVDQTWGRRPGGTLMLGYWPLWRSCGSSVGRCVSGRQDCVGGTWTTGCTGDIPPHTELCDMTDNDCDGTVDEGCGCTGGSTRPCGTSTGACTVGTQTCTVLGTWAACVGAIAPTTETCNGMDDDCDGAVDEEDAADCQRYIVDADSDGYGDSSQPSRCLCAPAGDHRLLERCMPGSPCLSRPRDCDDRNGGIHPGAVERCDAVDWNCDGIPDARGAMGCTVYYVDGDGDGYGGPMSRCLCAPTSTYNTTSGGDCCDADPRVHPGPGVVWHMAPTVCGGYDYNCDGTAELRSPNLFGCPNVCTSTDQGWLRVGEPPPNCGVPERWVDTCVLIPLPPFCFPLYHGRVQECR